MSQCPCCSQEVPRGGRYCPSCGSAVDETSRVPTETTPWADGERKAARTGPSSRFLPGVVLGNRYRIVSLLGRGGMGEVYRADDLKLGQPVALKFLPPSVERDSRRLERFLNEVKTALRVTHPNVCRVYDIGEVTASESGHRGAGTEGSSTGPAHPPAGSAASPPTGSGQGTHYISMEYVDGEDLASLLRRIGRLPRDKAAQIARQLCAGLAAAHEEGVLHRDLKPANVMIDGRGRAKITDFGLASLVGAVQGQEVGSGTPLYMAPEQLSGKEVTVRSDIYSLGLVLYELFTGRRAFEATTRDELLRLERTSAPADPSSHVEGLDPAVERAILRCLEKDPADRPRSALTVAAALPGGDPLSAALAAGETPSPEMVAEAGPRGGLRPGVAMACVGLVVLGLGALLWGPSSPGLLPWVSYEKSFEALEDDARDVVSALGYSESPVDSEARFSVNLNEFLHLVRGRDPEEARRALSRRGQIVLNFFYRQAPDSLVPNGLDGSVGTDDPPPGPGDVALRLDLKGDVYWMRAVPSFADWSAGPEPIPDWAGLFEAAGLDIEAFEPTSPTLRPRVFADTRMAWTGVLPDGGDRPVRIEAAALRGRPVFFEKVLPSDSYWSPSSEGRGEEIERTFKPFQFVAFGVLALVAAGAVLLAVRNLRLGRGDPRGALRLAFFVFALQMLYRLASGHHVAGFDEIYVVVVAFCGAVAFGLVIYVLYAALEPYVRKLWPESIVSWTRLLAGRFRDPLVGRDILVGLAFIGALNVLFFPIVRTLEAYDLTFLFPDAPVGALRGGRYALGEIFAAGLAILLFSLVFLTLFLVFRILFRRTWIAVVAFTLLWSGWTALQVGTFHPSPRMFAVGASFGVLNSIILLTLLVRFGLVATLAGFSFGLMNSFPITTDVSAPYFTIGLVPVFVTLALAAYGFHTALAGQAVFRDELLGVGAEAGR